MTPSTLNKLKHNTLLSPNKLVVVNNPIVDENVIDRSRFPINDQWLFASGSISVIAIGRLTLQKDFHTLIRSVDIAKNSIPLRVAVLGEGDLRDELQSEIDRRGLQNYIRLYGFVPNPFAYLGRARLFVLTSLWEDPGHAILEAAALRVPIVSTDCPSGPSSLLSNGRGGALCPVGDHRCLSEQMVETLSSNVSEKIELAYENAQHFSLKAHYDSYKPYLKNWQRSYED